MLSFLNILRGPQSDFLPEREVRHLRPATERDARAGLKLLDLAPAISEQLGASEPEAPDPTILQAAIRVLKAQLRVADEGAAKAKGVLDSYERKAARLMSKVKELKKEKERAEKGRRLLKKRLRATRRKALRREADLQQRLDTANSTVEELSGDVERIQCLDAQLSIDLIAASAHIQDLEGKLAASEAENALLKEELQRRDDQVKAEKSKLSEAMALLQAEKEKTQSLEARVAQLTRQLADKDNAFALEIDSLKLAASDMCAFQEQETLARVEDEHRARTAAEQERGAMQAERDQALADVASLKQIVDKLGSKIFELEEQHLAETLRSDALVVERDRHLEQLQNVEDALGEANTQYLDAKQASKQLREDLQAMQEAYNNNHVLLTLANGADEVTQARLLRLEKDNRELRASKQALADSMFKLRNASQDSISTPSTPTLASSDSGSGSRSGVLPFGSSLAFNFALQPEAPSPKPLRKARNLRRFFVRASQFRVCAIAEHLPD